MITSLSIDAISETSYVLTWASDLPTPTFRLYIDGSLAMTTKSTEGIVNLAIGQEAIFDIYDDDDVLVPERYPSNVTLAWNASPDAPAYYRVDQYVDSAWAEQARVVDDGRGSFTWSSGPLADCTTHQFRVVPISLGGHEGTATTFAMLVVRSPDVPQVGYAYNPATGVVLISAA